MSQEHQARIGFVGAGNHATESLYPNIAHIPAFHLAAVCDLDPDRAQGAKERFGAERSFTDVEAMLAEVPLDGVCVCGPPSMHHEVALVCLGKGIPVFVEKPPAEDLAGAIELASLAEKKNIFGMVGFMKRFAPANRVALEFMGTERFGRLSAVSLIHGSGPYEDPRKMMLFNGIHMVDLAFFLGGAINSLSAIGTAWDHDTKALVAQFQYQNGAVGCLNMNSGHHWRDCFEQAYVSGAGTGLLIDASRSVEIMGEGMRFADGEGLELFGWSGKYSVSGNMAGWFASGHYTRGYWGELQQFALACLGEAEPVPSLRDGVQAIRFIESALQSAEAHGETVPLLGDAS